MVYGVREYAAMLADRERVDAHLEALRRVVTPGSVVCDLGTGTGFFAVAACRLGARKVYAIDTSDSIQLARELAAANGFADRVELFRTSSLDVTLPERVDVLFYDLRGALPLLGHAIPSIIDARTRFLKPGGVQIALRDRLVGAPVEAEEAWLAHHAPWRGRFPDLGLDLGVLERSLLNSFARRRALNAALICDGVTFAEIDYRTVTNPSVEGTIECVSSREAVAHGVQVWFESDLAEGVTLSNRPSERETVYGACFMPWEAPVKLGVGDRIVVQLEAPLVGDDYVWRWRTRVTPKGAAAPSASFDQSTFFGTPMPIDGLARRAVTHRTALAEHGEVDRFVLERMASGDLVGDIARAVATRWPKRFRSEGDALSHVGALSDTYGR
jgi:protein arginine N-methyltransferase 1